MIRIITDSTSDLSKELLERYRVNVLPLHVSLGEAEYRDGVDIAPDQLYAWSDANKTTPKTSAPSLEDAVELFRPILQAGDEIIAFTISSSMSTSFNCMRLAAEELEASDRITVVDSASLSTGIGLLVLEAAQMAEKGFSRQQIAQEMERLKPLVRASFVVDTLTYLYRGGRCSGVAALAGGVLKLHPCIRVENGAMVVGKKYRGKYDKIVLDYVKDMEEAILSAKSERIFITHSGIDQAVIDSVKAYLEQLNRFREIHVTCAGSVISSHCGYGTLGVLFLAQE